MGFVLWILAGVLAFGLARIVPLGRRKRWWIELLLALATAIGLGLLATALDFGGLAELEWRADVFSFLGALAMVGIVRAV